MHICVTRPQWVKRTRSHTYIAWTTMVIYITSGNGLSPVRRQAINWTSAGLLSIALLGTNFSEIRVRILSFSFKNVHLKLSSVKMAAVLSRGRWVNLVVLKYSCLSTKSININIIALLEMDSRKYFVIFSFISIDWKILFSCYPISCYWRISSSYGLLSHCTLVNHY